MTAADEACPPRGAERVLILAPLGRDSAIAAGLLREAGLIAEPCGSVPELVDAIKIGAGCAVLAQEAVQNADLRLLSEWLADQPSWSDLPLIIMTHRGDGLQHNPAARRLTAALGNVTLLERPFHPSTFLSLVQSALRSRRRQYQARAHMAALEQREHQLRESESRFRSLAENIPVLAWSADADGWIVWYNSRWYEYTGKTPAEMEGWGWQSVHHPDTLPAVTEKWQAALRTGDLFEMVFPLRRADGVFHPFLTRVVPVREAGRVVRWFGTNVDISAERDAEAAIRASEEKLRVLNETLEQQVAERTERLRVNKARLRTIFETSYQGQGLLDVDGTVQEANARLLSWIGCGLDDLAGMKFWESPWFAATPGVPATVRAAVEAAAGGEGVRQEIAIIAAQGLRTLDLSIRPIRDEAGAVVAIVSEAADITSERMAEEALRQAQKMEAIGQLTGGIAHDFNNMLQGIASAIELMRRRIRAGRTAEAEHYVEAAQQGIDRAAALTHRLLAFSRRQALAPKSVDLEALVSGMGGLIRQTVGPAITVKVELTDAGWPVNCDPNQLENALLNLAINARDAMVPHGGGLLVRTEHVVLTARDLAGWQDAQPGEYVRVSVMDTGSGMPPDVLRHAFEPFFTTKPAGQGTGLGLSQVFGFISQSKGMVRIDSEVGRGTSVHLYLPRQVEPVEAVQSTEGTEPANGSVAGASVLLVEDEAGIRSFAAEALRDLGCRVFEAADGTTGLTLLREPAGKRIDMLIADIGLPGGLNGRQLADAARELSPRLPVLLITGYAGEALGPGRQLGDRMELLIKPFALDALASRVEAMLSSARPGRYGPRQRQAAD